MAEIKKLIKTSGPLPVWRYMQICLTHPEHGYYISRDPLGREGDFITSPEVSQMFGELIGLWAASVWRMMGSPATLRLIELGPGRGTMMADALRALRVLPPMYDALSVHLVEINPVLREKQEATLSGARNVEWHAGLDEVPRGPAIILANEYFDVLPVRQMVRHGDGWHERVVDVDGSGQLVFGAAAEPMPRFDALLPPLAPRRDVVAEEQRQQIRQVAVRPQHRLLGAPTHACHAPIHVPYLQALLSFLCLKRNRIHQPLPGKRMQASKDQPAVLSQDDLGGA